MNVKKTQIGTVLSRKMEKTAIVVVERMASETKTGKSCLFQKKYKVHDEKNQCRTGDQVLIAESRPLSREKRWVLQAILKHGYVEAEGNKA